MEWKFGDGKKRIGKGYVKLRKMVIQVRILHAKINNKGTEDK